MIDVKTLSKQFLHFLDKNSPAILTALGSIGVVSTAVMTHVATTKANEFVRTIDPYPQTKLEYLKLTWRYYVPPAIMGATSIASIVCANKINTKRNIALAGLYTLSENALIDFKKKVAQNVKPKDFIRMEDEIYEEKIKKNPPKDEQIIITGKGDMLCYDCLSGRYFKSDIEKLRRIMNDLNKDLIDTMWVSVNDLYFLLGLESIKMGEDIGWKPDTLLDFKFSSRLTDDGEPCIVLDYNMIPKFR